MMILCLEKTTFIIMYYSYYCLYYTITYYNYHKMCLFIAVSITQFLFTELKNQIETQVNELKTQIEGKCVMQ